MKIALYAFSIFMIVATLMPVVKKDYWTFRVFDYPRFQKLILISALIVIWLTEGYQTLSQVDFGIVFALFLLWAWLIKQIIPYSPFYPKMVISAKKQEEESIELLVANVYQYNDQYEKARQLLEKEQADIFVLVETDQRWKEEIEVFKSEYPYQVELPIDNTYGMLLYSKLELQNVEINYLINEEVPSIAADITVQGQTVRLHAIHPTPPVPGENTHSTERDAEILMVGKRVKEENIPSIIMGDLNDVAWSYTTELFLKISGMGDPRRGRGMYNTFHAKYPFMRWPLDHFFVSSHFRVKKIKVHNSIGSDHFPISIALVINPATHNEKLEASAEEKEEAEEKIVQGINF